MEKTVLMHVSQTKEGLVHDGLNLVFREVSGPIFHKLVDILFHVLENEVEIIVNSNNLLQLDDVDVIQFSQ